jgi:hypothetical protein
MSHDRYESADFSPGIYIGTLEASRVVRSVQTGNVGVTAYWAVTDVFGRARRAWRTFWLSDAALPYTKRELRQFGIRALEDLDFEDPLPVGLLCRLTVAEVVDREGYREARVIRCVVLTDKGDT